MLGIPPRPGRHGVVQKHRTEQHLVAALIVGQPFDAAVCPVDSVVGARTGQDHGLMDGHLRVVDPVHQPVSTAESRSADARRGPRRRSRRLRADPESAVPSDVHRWPGREGSRAAQRGFVRRTRARRHTAPHARRPWTWRAGSGAFGHPRPCPPGPAPRTDSPGGPARRRASCVQPRPQTRSAWPTVDQRARGDRHASAQPNHPTGHAGQALSPAGCRTPGRVTAPVGRPRVARLLAQPSADASPTGSSTTGVSARAEPATHHGPSPLKARRALTSSRSRLDFDGALDQAGDQCRWPRPGPASDQIDAQPGPSRELAQRQA